MNNEAGSQKTRVFIYGSCVSRDTFEHLPQDGFSLVKYVARQSLISAFSPSNTRFDLNSLGSAFQRRMVEDDVVGSLPSALAAHQDDIDLLVWDLADERLGVYRTSDANYLTRSLETIRADLTEKTHPTWEHLPFGSNEHFALWSSASRQFARLRAHLGLSQRTVLLNVPWASQTLTGDSSPASFGLDAHTANALFQRYYEAAIDMDPTLRLLTIPTSDALSDNDHPWGPAPFHYAVPVYRSLTGSIVRAFKDRDN